ncbi:hypothetical protein LJK88_24460 [Paenibacillus sp. P26]|nr:hypothetical protein LJK88_24460 [Paenibacillus sp. P26]
MSRMKTGEVKFKWTRDQSKLRGAALAVVMTSLALAGCGSPDGKSGAGEPAKQASGSDPLKISMMLDFSGKERAKAGQSGAASH